MFDLGVWKGNVPIAGTSVAAESFIGWQANTPTATSADETMRTLQIQVDTIDPGFFSRCKTQIFCVVIRADPLITANHRLQSA